MKTVHVIAVALVIIGALNWGLVGLFDFNLVAAIFGADTAPANIVYVLVGLAGLVVLVTEFMVHGHATHGAHGRIGHASHEGSVSHQR